VICKAFGLNHFPRWLHSWTDATRKWRNKNERIS